MSQNFPFTAKLLTCFWNQNHFPYLSCFHRRRGSQLWSWWKHLEPLYWNLNCTFCLHEYTYQNGSRLCKEFTLNILKHFDTHTIILFISITIYTRSNMFSGVGPNRVYNCLLKISGRCVWVPKDIYAYNSRFELRHWWITSRKEWDKVGHTPSPLPEQG